MATTAKRGPKAAPKALRLVTLEDRGQDFLRWVLDENGVVVDCGPFQGWLWNGTRVHNETIKRGTVLDITTKRGDRTTLNYRATSCRPIDRIERVSA